MREYGADGPVASPTYGGGETGDGDGDGLVRHYGRESSVKIKLTKKLKLENPIFASGFQKRCKGVHCVDLGESFRTHI